MRVTALAWCAVLALGGCTLMSDDTDVVTAAREMVERVQATYDAELADHDVVRRVVDGPSGCTEPPDRDRFQSAVFLTVQYDGDVEQQLQRLHDRWEQDEGIENLAMELDDGPPRVEATDDRGTTYVARWVQQSGRLALVASTDCMPLPGDYDHVRDLRPEFTELVDPDGERIEP
jgi:hypothetical protein